ncbi:sensor histidine kinase [Singulisphaera acidiphila]|uniref:histidine kinase n=1 Tax=Singulisphaera acidiphila (strain ATCC BAA-1392 / DSM 18658 / VKM B-2454 / MOB10) TaxID=886293 RepID=L0DG77_SINAD|nr:ATP-binding protein [Singulisphaera acidiphila]AGA27681.1 PAS domain S-box [Singulisphaera acidiphila DSM 18658]
MLVPAPGAGTGSPAGLICRLEPNTLRWLDVTENLGAFLGQSLGELRKQSFLEYLHHDDQALAEDEFRQALELGERHDFVLRVRGASGEWHYLRVHTQARYERDGRVNHIRCNLKDVTDRIRAEQELRRRTEQLTDANQRLRQANEKLKEAQSQLIHSEKLASLGTLAAGMAHEINNPLAFASSNVEVLERELGAILTLLERYRSGWDILEQARPDLAAEIAQLEAQVDMPYLQENLLSMAQSTRKGLKRVAQTVQNLRGFAQLDRAEIGEIDVNLAIDQSLSMLGDLLNRNQIEVVRRFADLPLIECAPAHINQVFLNLLMNAMQAIEASGRPSGRLEVVTGHQGELILVELTDDGCGIPPEILSKIFDPFFTTKPIGRGTGLGLSLIHGIISEHGGRVDVESEVGSGTRFRIQMPIRRPIGRAQSPSDSNLPGPPIS